MRISGRMLQQSGLIERPTRSVRDSGVAETTWATVATVSGSLQTGTSWMRSQAGNVGEIDGWWYMRGADATPQQGDRLTVSGVEYTIDGVEDMGARGRALRCPLRLERRLDA